jgi:hypothetical protein
MRKPRRAGSEVMLVIRDMQVAAFRADAQRRFAERMRAYIAQAYPARYQALGDEGTKLLIQKGVEAGERHHLENEGAVSVFIELMVEFGERFERSPDRAWAERILAQPDLPGEVKVSAVRERLHARTGGRSLKPVAVREPRNSPTQRGTQKSG